MKYLIFLLGLSLLAGCGKPAAEHTAAEQTSAATLSPLAGAASGIVVNAEPVPQALLDAYISRQGLNAVDPNQLKQAQEHIARLVALAQKAVTDGATKRPEVELQRLEFLSGVAIFDGLATLPPLDDVLLRTRYDAEREKIGGLEYQVEHLLFRNGALADEASAALASGKAFADLMETYKGNPQVHKAEVMEWIHLGRIPDEHEALRAAIRGLKPGEFTPKPIITPGGWHLAAVTAIRPFEFPPFDSLRQQIEATEQRARQEQVVEQIRSAAQVTGLQ